ncbi:MAG: phage baseplate assembly protein V, partial [Gemmatimonadales bacterium]
MSCLEGLIDSVEESIDTLNRKFYGVVTGKVRSVSDPMNLGRVQLTLPFLDDSDSSPWARIAAPMAGNFHGHYFIPRVDDEVLVAFEHGDVKAPYVLGALWTAKAQPPLSSPSSEKRAIRTPGGSQIVFEDRPDAITIQTGPTPTQSLPGTVSPTGSNHSLALTNSGIELASPKEIVLGVQHTKIAISSEGVEITLGASKIKLSTSSIDLEAPSISIKATGALTLRGST